METLRFETSRRSGKRANKHVWEWGDCKHTGGISRSYLVWFYLFFSRTLLWTLSFWKVAQLQAKCWNIRFSNTPLIINNKLIPPTDHGIKTAMCYPVCHFAEASDTLGNCLQTLITVIIYGFIRAKLVRCDTYRQVLCVHYHCIVQCLL